MEVRGAGGRAGDQAGHDRGRPRGAHASPQVIARHVGRDQERAWPVGVGVEAAHHVRVRRERAGQRDLGGEQRPQRRIAGGVAVQALDRAGPLAGLAVVDLAELAGRDQAAQDPGAGALVHRGPDGSIRPCRTIYRSPKSRPP
jgi:hypothetical protein